MKKNGFFIIERFMVDELRLKGNELIIYGIIYGFSKNNSAFNGSLSYLASWVGASKQTVITVIKSLINKGLIQKIGVNKSMRTYIYRASYNLTDKSQKNIADGSKDFTEIGQNIVPTNIDNNINNKIDNNMDSEIPNDNLELYKHMGFI